MNARPDPLSLIAAHASDVMSAILARKRQPEYEFDIEVREDSTILTAILYSDAQGNVEERELDLDEFLSNEDGEFEWTGKEVGTPGKSFDEPVPQRLPRM